tara:strand:+ start:102 stop:518 length:417 start_codon:yes stop_codon:yes gene_type:complete
MEKLLHWIINHDEVSILCCPSFLFVNKIKKFGIKIDNINFDVNFKEMPNVICKDFVFDDVKLNECVVNYNCEKTFPVGKMHKGILILRGDDKEHNGDCNPITSVNQLIEQNKIETVYDSFIMKSKNKKYNQYCVYGSN